MCRCFQTYLLFIWFLGLKGLNVAPDHLCHSELCHHSANCEEVAQKETRCGSFPLASTSLGAEDFVNCSAGIYQKHIGSASQQGPETSSPYQCRDVQQKPGQWWLDVRQLQEAQGQKCVVLRPMWFSLGRMYCLSKTKSTAIKVDITKSLLDRAVSSSVGTRSWREKSEAASKKESRQGKGQAQGSFILRSKRHLHRLHRHR